MSNCTTYLLIADNVCNLRDVSRSINYIPDLELDLELDLDYRSTRRMFSSLKLHHFVNHSVFLLVSPSHALSLPPCFFSYILGGRVKSQIKFTDVQSGII